MGPFDQDPAVSDQPAVAPAAPVAPVAWTPSSVPAPPVPWGPPSPPQTDIVARPSVRQWSARDVGVVSVLLGFPSGLGLSAVNDHRLGRTAPAVVALVVLAAGGLIIALAPRLGLIVSVVTGIVLYRRVKSDRRVLDAAGVAVLPGGILKGLATIVAAWALVLAPIVTLEFLGEQVQDLLAGTIEFGHGGSGCVVSDAATTFAQGEVVHLTAHLTRTVQPGEVIVEKITSPDGTPESSSHAVATNADCLSQDLTPRELGSYRVEITTGAERLAAGSFVVSVAPSTGP